MDSEKLVGVLIGSFASGLAALVFAPILRISPATFDVLKDTAKDTARSAYESYISNPSEEPKRAARSLAPYIDIEHLVNGVQLTYYDHAPNCRKIDYTRCAPIGDRSERCSLSCDD
jgi:hypothetical protein